MIGQAPFWRAGCCVRKAGFDKRVGESAEKTHCNLIAGLNAHALLGAETTAVAGMRFHTRSVDLCLLQHLGRFCHSGGHPQSLPSLPTRLRQALRSRHSPE